MSDPISITDLDLNDHEKALLAYLSAPRSILNVAAKFSISFSGSWQKLNILAEKGLVVKVTTAKGNKLYKLNELRVVNQ